MSLVQPKLKIGQPNDRYEQEADSMADKILSAPAPAVQTKEAATYITTADPISTADVATKKAEVSTSTLNSIHRSSISSVAQPRNGGVLAKGGASTSTPKTTKPSTPPTVSPLDVQAEFESNEAESIQPKLESSYSAPNPPPADSSDESQRGNSLPLVPRSSSLVQRAATPSVMRGDAEPEAPSDFESQLSSSRGGGTPMASGTQSEMEGHFDSDFSGVRVHTDANAVQMSQDIGARAFTHGSDIYFNQGEYSPDTSSGKHLLAHELTHTVQQGASPALHTKQLPTESRESPAKETPSVAPAKKTSLVQRAAQGIRQSLSKTATKAVQRGWLGDKLNEYANHIPGWYLLTVVVGYNPLTERDVPQRASNFLKGMMGLIPGGTALYDVLNKHGGVESAFQWLKRTQNEMGLTWRGVTQMAEDAWDDMTLAYGFSHNFNILKRYFNRLYSKVERFADKVIDKVISILKEAILVPLAKWIKEQTPAYDLFTVILGKDPITNKEVPRSLANIVTGFLKLDPDGEAYLQKLQESGKLQEISDWLDGQMGTLEINPVTIIQNWVNFFSSLNVDKLINLGQTFKDLWGLISRPITSVVNFVINVTVEVLTAVKDWMIASLIDFIKTQTNAYPLLTVILGHDPITDQPVERTPSKILEGFLILTGNTEYLRQLQETGKMAELDVWVEEQMANLGLGLEALKQGFISLWENFKITDLLQPGQVFMQIFNVFYEPASRIGNFIVEVAKYVLKFIKDFLIFQLKKHAHKIPGYPLLTVLLKRDPLTGEAVPRTAKNFIRGFLSLVPGGLEKYQQLEESGTIDRTFEWLEKEIALLNLSWDAIVALFTEMWEGFSINDLTEPVAAFERIVGIFADPVRRIIRFAGNVGIKVLEFIFQGFLFLAGPLGQKVFEVVKKTGETITQIYNDPIGFIKNVIEAIKMGIGQFVKNILKHLQTILINWLFGSMQGEIQMPAKFDLMGILSLGLQILGLTYANFRERLAKKIGEEKVARLEEAFDFIKLIVTDGLAAAWQKILEFGTDIINGIINGIRDMVIGKIIEIGMQKLAMLLAGPYGAIVEAILTTYRVIATLIERIEQIADFVGGVVDSVKDIADGKLGNAANAIEQTLVKGFTMMVSFLAGAFGLGNIPKKIKQVIDAVRRPVNTAIDKVIDWVINAGKSVLQTFQGGRRDPQADPNMSAEDREQQIQAGVSFLKEEEKKEDQDNDQTLSQEKAVKVAQNTKARHPVFTQITPQPGNSKWEYHYIHRKKIKGSTGPDDDPFSKAWREAWGEATVDNAVTNNGAGGGVGEFIVQGVNGTRHHIMGKANFKEPAKSLSKFTSALFKPVLNGIDPKIETLRKGYRAMIGAMDMDEGGTANGGQFNNTYYWPEGNLFDGIQRNNRTDEDNSNDSRPEPIKPPSLPQDRWDDARAWLPSMQRFGTELITAGESASLDKIAGLGASVSRIRDDFGAVRRPGRFRTQVEPMDDWIIDRDHIPVLNLDEFFRLWGTDRVIYRIQNGSYNIDDFED